MRPAVAQGLPRILVGTAGWRLPGAMHAEFPASGTHLKRYAARLPAVEINSSFYRPHRRSSYAKWAASVPEAFRFCVKLPKAITHVHRLDDVGAPLTAFLDEAGGLGKKLGCLLVQLPPSLAFDATVATAFFTCLRGSVPQGGVALEARHASWFAPDAQRMLEQHLIAGVAADPSPVADAAKPSGWTGTVYYRLHGSPRMYYSAYGEEKLKSVAAALDAHADSGRDVWCVFDNTADGAALPNAFALLDDLRRAGEESPQNKKRSRA